MKHLVLVGGGHAHLFVLEKLAAIKPATVQVTLITPSHMQFYSGMLPGLMAGHYKLAQCQIDLQVQALRANVRLIEQRVTAIEVNLNCVCLADGQTIEYDFLSLDVGSETQHAWLDNYKQPLLQVKPLDRFYCAWKTIADDSSKQSLDFCIVGAGAAGVELALAARYAIPASRVTLIAGGGVLPSFSTGMQHRTLQVLSSAGVSVIKKRMTATIEGLQLDDGRSIKADVVIAAAGATAPTWLKASALCLDDKGFIQVDKFHCSVSHGNIFAAGDVCSRADVKMSRSGVHAVRVGPVLAHNLLAAIHKEPLKAYLPRKHSLYLLACGRRYAIASWGNFSLQGRWVWFVKNWIDQGFIKRFTQKITE